MEFLIDLIDSYRSGTWDPTRATHAAQQFFIIPFQREDFIFYFFRTPSLSGGGTPMDLQTGWRSLLLLLFIIYYLFILFIGWRKPSGML